MGEFKRGFSNRQYRCGSCGTQRIIKTNHTWPVDQMLCPSCSKQPYIAFGMTIPGLRTSVPRKFDYVGEGTNMNRISEVEQQFVSFALGEIDETKCLGGCGSTLTPFDMQWGVCMGCTKARHRAVLNRGKCGCGSKKVPGDIARTGSRSWVPCNRCLGSIKQLS